MALQKGYSKNIYGETLNFEAAYHKITFLSGNKEGINIQVTTYGDGDKKHVILERGYFFNPSVENGAYDFIKQGYEYLKTLEEYSDAIDILDEGQIE